MKSKLNRINHILHRHLNDGDISAMFRRTLIVLAIGIWLAFALSIMLAWIYVHNS